MRNHCLWDRLCPHVLYLIYVGGAFFNDLRDNISLTKNLIKPVRLQTCALTLHLTLVCHLPRAIGEISDSIVSWLGPDSTQEHSTHWRYHRGHLLSILLWDPGLVCSQKSYLFSKYTNVTKQWEKFFGTMLNINNCVERKMVLPRLYNACVIAHIGDIDNETFISE